MTAPFEDTLKPQPPRQVPNMKRLYFICAALLICVLYGCSAKKDAPPSNADAKTDTPKVALIMKSLANEFFSKMAEGAQTHQAEHSDQYSLIVNGIKDERDLSRQVSLVEEMVASGVDAIVIAPADSKALVPVLRRAMSQGVVVVNIDNRLDADVLRAEDIKIPFVGPDNRTGAKAVGDYLMKSLKIESPKIAILEGIPTSFNAQQRKLGFEDSIREAGGTIVASQTADWEMAKANTIASSILSEHPDLHAIMASNDSMAMGALAAVKSAGRSGDIAVVGFDNITAVQTAIQNGEILATADQHGSQLAVFGIEAALKIVNGETIDGDSETPVDLITRANLVPKTASEQ